MLRKCSWMQAVRTLWTIAILALVGTPASAQGVARALPFPAGSDVVEHDPAHRLISVDLDDLPLERALAEISRSSDLRITYSRDVLPRDHRVSLRNERMRVSQLFTAVLRGTALDFRISPAGGVIIYPALASAPTESRQGSITGTISDAITGAPLGGVQVSTGGDAATITGEDGAYVLSGVPAGTHLLRARLIGYASQERTVEVLSGAAITIDFQLQPQGIVLEGIVAVGYGSQERRDVSGSIASVQGSELQSQPVASVSSALQGRAPGLVVVTSGVPGEDAALRIRGTSTVGNSDALVVINGVPTTAGLNQINPRDIERIEVLKDASATAIYGSRGANGVIIVTTRSGSSSGRRAEFAAYSGYQEVQSMIPMLDAAAFASLHNEVMENAGRPLNPDFADPAQLGVGTDWLGELIGTAPIHSVSASVSGGGDATTYYLSGNALRQDGVVRRTGFERYTLQLNANSDVLDWLTLGNNLTLNHDRNGSGSYDLQAAMAAQPTQPIFNEDGSYSGPRGRSEWVGDVVNPIGQAMLIDNSTSGYNLIGSVFGEVRLSDDLGFRTNAGLQANFWDQRTWAPEYDWQPNPQEESYLYERSNRNVTWVVDNTLTYSRLFGEHHDLTLLAGTSAQANRYSFMDGSVQGFASDRTQELVNGILPPTLNGSRSEWGLLSYFGRVNYAYDDTYLLTATLRRDGSSRFGAANRWGLFPSVSAAWRLSNESLLADVQFIDDLKLRLGFGSTGNQEIGNYTFASSLQTIQYNFGGNLVSGVVPSVMPNPEVHWESVDQYNLGLDASLLGSRLQLTVDAYLKNTSGMLVPMSVPVTTGYSDIVTPFVNAGRMRNRGVEIELSSRNLQGTVDWRTDLQFAYNQNEVLRLNDTIPMNAGSVGFNYTVARHQAGRPVNSFYGFVTNGIFQTQEEVDQYAVQVPGADPYNRTSPGDIRFVDLNNDGVINDDDRTYLGDPNPDFVFGLNNRLAIGAFDLELFVHGVAGNQVFNANRIWTEGMSSARNQSRATRDRWSGPNSSNSMPRAIFGDPNGNTRASDRYIEDGSYLRLRTATIGYTLPAELVRTMSVGQVRLYATGQNLLTITGYSGFDPEVNIAGIDHNVYPVTRTVSVGFDLRF